MNFEELLQQAALGDSEERNRLRKVESPLPGTEVQEIGMLIISPALDDRISELSRRTGLSAGEVIARALSVYEKAVVKTSEPYEMT